MKNKSFYYHSKPLGWYVKKSYGKYMFYGNLNNGKKNTLLSILTAKYGVSMVKKSPFIVLGKCVVNSSVSFCYRQSHRSRCAERQ